MRPIGTTKVIVIGTGWLAAAFEYGKPPLYFWPSGQHVQAVVGAAGGDVAGGTLEAWQATMARVSAALLAGGFVVIPRGADDTHQVLSQEEAAEEANRRGY